MRGDLAAAKGPPGGVGVSPWRALFRGLTRRCPRCGRGKLFRRWFSLAERCPRCGLVFEREEGAFLGSLALNYGVTGVSAVVFLAVMLARTLPDPPLGIILGGAIGITIFVPLLVYPFAKTTWAAIDLILHRRRSYDAAAELLDGNDPTRARSTIDRRRSRT